MSRQLKRLQEGERVAQLRVTTLAGESVTIPDQGVPWTHLQFRRFAGCPICNLHVRDVARRHDEIRTAGIREVVFFHSKPETMREFQGDLPLDVVPDPDRTHYDRFGVGTSPKAVLDPRAWGALVRGALAKHPSSATRGEGGHLGLPAEFLVGRDGRIAACKYGVHADDHWSVDELLDQARRAASAP